MTSLKVIRQSSGNEIPLNIDFDQEIGKNVYEIRTASGIFENELSLQIETSVENTAIYLSDSADSYVSGSTVYLNEYEQETDGEESYVKIPIRLVSENEDQSQSEKEYILFVLLAKCYPVIDTQPESVSKTKNALLTTALTVSATATGEGTLSYQWYEVSENGAEKLTDSSATTDSYKVSLKNLGVRSFYCEVTNTVNGKDYSVNTDTAQVTVYQNYVQSLTITTGEDQVVREYGKWPGKEINVTLDASKAYTLTVLPINKVEAKKYSMRVSYNGEAAEVGAFQNKLTLDNSKLPDFTRKVSTFSSDFFRRDTTFFYSFVSTFLDYYNKKFYFRKNVFFCRKKEKKNVQNIY